MRLAITERALSITPIGYRNVQQFWPMLGPEWFVVPWFFHAGKEACIRIEERGVILFFVVFDNYW
jgi:hypothetical protein